jgi:hypothetical protein
MLGGTTKIVVVFKRAATRLRRFQPQRGCDDFNRNVVATISTATRLRPKAQGCFNLGYTQNRFFNRNAVPTISTATRLRPKAQGCFNLGYTQNRFFNRNAVAAIQPQRGCARLIFLNTRRNRVAVATREIL